MGAPLRRIPGLVDGTSQVLRAVSCAGVRGEEQLPTEAYALGCTPSNFFSPGGGGIGPTSPDHGGARVTRLTLTSSVYDPMQYGLTIEARHETGYI